MKKASIIFNSPYLGGAERSIIIQTSKLSCNYFIPYFKNENECENIVLNIKEYSNSDIYYFKYPEYLFSISRTSFFFNPVLILRDLFVLKKSVVEIIKQTDLIWCNGNKVALIFLIFNKLFFYNKKIIWHFRDYPSSNILYRFIWSFIAVFTNKNELFLANSKSVEHDIQKKFYNLVNTDFVYNPIGNLNIAKDNSTFNGRIGIVSMIAPWKGLTEISNWANTNTEFLHKLGINEICIYGSDIYKTKGEHSNYFNLLKSEINKNNKSLVRLMGLEDPCNIYKNIDILIHCSVQREPFGRVIVEAASCNIPVISTGLGGAGELIELIGAYKYDYLNSKSLKRIIDDIILYKGFKGYKADFYSWDENILKKIDFILSKCMILG